MWFQTHFSKYIIFKFHLFFQVYLFQTIIFSKKLKKKTEVNAPYVRYQSEKNELTTNIFFCLTYRIPCRSGICRTPIQVTCSQLIASELFPTIVVKALLYPGAIANALFKNKTIPSYNNLLELYNMTNMKAALATSDLHRIEVSIFKLLFHDYPSFERESVRISLNNVEKSIQRDCVCYKQTVLYRNYVK